jgi:hypothetical protein
MIVINPIFLLAIILEIFAVGTLAFHVDLRVVMSLQVSATICLILMNIDVNHDDDSPTGFV